ncbi:MAG: anthranilate synthase component I family protein [Deltaproteobacteria bacterium]|nr:anthranilate synthase component I family protein [Deltaproteobacteria bacterium]
MAVEKTTISPVTAFEALRGLKRPFVLSGSHFAGSRHTVVGAAPFLTIDMNTSGAVIVPYQGRPKTERFEDPFDFLGSYFADIRHSPVPGAAFPFTPAAVGYFSYDLKDVAWKTAKTNAAPSDIPLASLSFYSAFYVYDHTEGSAHIASFDVPEGLNAAAIVRNTLKGAETSDPGASACRFQRATEGIESSSSMSKEEYIEAVNRAKAYITAGDVYQINIARFLSMPFSGDPYCFFRAMADNYPSRFPSYMDFSSFQIIANTPERFLSIRGHEISTEPIKGTRKRAADKEADKALIEELKHDPKENAEHVMIVDLSRSDIGRVSVTGSVSVDGFKRVETYPNLHHMVSTVSGKLLSGINAFGALKEIFPGGSVTGTPKRRATEIIDEIEGKKRGLYTGALGWIGLNGDMDLAMAIRTAVVKDNAVTLGIGSGIVADSNPEREFDETGIKAKDFLKAAASITLESK